MTDQPYGYSGQDPVNSFDLDGTMTCEECGGDFPGARINSHGDQENGPGRTQEPPSPNTQRPTGGRFDGRFWTTEERWDHILDRHGPESTWSNKSKFNEETCIACAIRQTLERPSRVARSATNARNMTYDRRFSDPVGVDMRGRPVYGVRVVVNPYGIVWTAYPRG